MPWLLQFSPQSDLDPSPLQFSAIFLDQIHTAALFVVIRVIWQICFAPVDGHTLSAGWKGVQDFAVDR